MIPIRAIVKTMRPRQWVKNGFVAAPLVFSKHLLDPSFSLTALAATAAFCALSGAVYTYNDLRDVHQDRQHPVKKNRPIAAGELGENAALWTAGCLAGGALIGGLLIDPLFAALALGYLVNNLVYSIHLKHVAFVDVSMISLGFLLRVAAGAFAIGVPISPWLLACTALLSAMLGFGKRAHELVHNPDGRTRKALAGYSIRTLRWVMAVLGLATSASYALYCVDARTVDFFDTQNLLWTLPFCITGILRFVQLALWKPRLESPTDAMLRDWPFMLNIAAWGAAVVYIIYGQAH